MLNDAQKAYYETNNLVPKPEEKFSIWMIRLRNHLRDQAAASKEQVVTEVRQNTGLNEIWMTVPSWNFNSIGEAENVFRELQPAPAPGGAA